MSFCLLSLVETSDMIKRQKDKKIKRQQDKKTSVLVSF